MSILVVITSSAEAASLTEWGELFAKACNTDLNLLHVTQHREEKVLEYQCHEEAPSEEEEPMLHVAAKAWNKIRGKDDGEDTKKTLLRRVFGPDPEQIIISEIEQSGAELVIVSEHGEYSEKIFKRSQCHTLLLRTDTAPEEGDRCKSILIPVSGGPHSRVALDFGEKLAEVCDAKITTLYIQSDIDEVSKEVGFKLLQKHVGKKRLEDNPRLVPRVELANDIQTTISKVVEEGYDLVLVGASNTGTIRKILFGAIPFKVMASDKTSVIGIIRAEQPLSKRFQLFIERWLDLFVPPIEREERVALVQNLQSGSEWNFDFLALITLSTAIAAIGLIQNSTAVVIGAMLVAPLMTPLLGSGLSLVQANLPLVKTASRSILFGFFTALMVSYIVGLLVPFAELNSELMARGAPTILDLGIAFLSGIAAAHCLSRPGLSAALPGVAIAAALVPPIGTVGVALALGERAVAQGAVILFGANVVAIILGAAFSFYAGGIRANAEQSRATKWARRALLSLILMVAILSVPLGSLFLSKITEGDLSSSRARITIGEELEKELGSEGISVKSIQRMSREPSRLTVKLSAPTVLTGEQLKKISLELKQRYLNVAKVQIKTELESEL